MDIIPKQLLAFFALTFVWSWSCWLLVSFVKPDLSFVSTTLFFLGGFGPTVAAFTLIAISSGFKGLRVWVARCLQWRGIGRWIVLGMLSPLAVLATVAAIHIALGGAIPASPSAGHAALLLANFGLVFLVGGPLGEEFGWRGYALPVLLERFNWRVTSLVIGVVWGLWHLPLFFIAGSSQHQGSMVIFFALIVATSVFYTWLFTRSAGSVVPALMLHTASNFWPSVIPILPTDANQRPFLLVVGLVISAALWLILRRDRNYLSQRSSS